MVISASELQFSCSIPSLGLINNAQSFLVLFIIRVEIAFQRAISLSLFCRQKIKSLEGLRSGKVLLQQKQNTLLWSGRYLAVHYKMYYCVTPECFCKSTDYKWCIWNKFCLTKELTSRTQMTNYLILHLA